jgi:hypothetical protein
MMRLAATVFLALSLGACADAKRQVVALVVPPPAHPVVLINASAADVDRALSTRLESKGWTRNPAAPPWTFAYSQPMNGVLASLMSMENATGALARYELQLTESSGSVKLQGRFLVQNDPTAEGQEMGGQPLTRLDKMFLELKQTIEAAKK